MAKFGVVVEEADEVVYWLEFLEKTGLGDARLRSELLAEARELRAIFAAALATARRNRAASRRRT